MGDLGSILCELGRLAEAESFLRQAVALQPDLTVQIATYPFSYADKIDTPSLNNRFEPVTARPADAELHFQLGITLQEMSRLEEAEPHLREAVRCGPTIPCPTINLERSFGHASNGTSVKPVFVMHWRPIRTTLEL